MKYDITNDRCRRNNLNNFKQFFPFSQSRWKTIWKNQFKSIPSTIFSVFWDIFKYSCTIKSGNSNFIFNIQIYPNTIITSTTSTTYSSIPNTNFPTQYGNFDKSLFDIAFTITGTINTTTKISFFHSLKPKAFFLNPSMLPRAYHWH